MKNLETLITTLENIDSVDALNSVLLDLPDSHNYQWCGIILFRPISAMQHDSVSIGDIPRDFHGQCMESNLLFHYCTSQFQPTLASAIYKAEKKQSLENQSILLIPMKGQASNCGCLILKISDSALPFVKQLGWYWSIVSPYLYDATKRTSPWKATPISKRELECIRWASEGKTSWEISKILSITESTVNFHLANCINKTESVNRQQAIVKCLLQGRLSFS